MKSAPLKILLVEDSPTDAALLRALLQQVVEFSYEIDLATDLQSGLSKLPQTKYDVVILDLGLPDSQGLKTYERFREQADFRLPIIIVTGNDDSEVLSAAQHKGADNYLRKEAFDGNRIAIAVLSAIRNRSRVLRESVPPQSNATIEHPQGHPS